jgi:hypothetical protein
MDHTVATYLRIAADVCVRGVQERHPILQHQTPNSCASQEIFEFRKFRARVNARDLARVGMLIQGDALLFCLQDGRHVGQIIFALTVSRPHLLERGE